MHVADMLTLRPLRKLQAARLPLPTFKTNPPKPLMSKNTSDLSGHTPIVQQ